MTSKWLQGLRRQSFCNISMHQISASYTLNFHNVVCKLYLHKAGKKTITVVKFYVMYILQFKKFSSFWFVNMYSTFRNICFVPSVILSGEAWPCPQSSVWLRNSTVELCVASGDSLHPPLVPCPRTLLWIIPTGSLDLWLLVGFRQRKTLQELRGLEGA